MARNVLCWFSLVVFVFSCVVDTSDGALQVGFYRRSCPNAEKIVRDITWKEIEKNSGFAAKILRVQYHDCFVRGCDASLLLDGAEAEKTAGPNNPLNSSGVFDVYDRIKEQLELACPGIVSCADIIALAARDAVSKQFRFSLWNVFTGRRDGQISIAGEVRGNLPSASSNFDTVQASFSRKGLNVRDLVALSGAHTIGVSHCGAFSGRLRNFKNTSLPDPSLDPKYGDFLRLQKCSETPDRNVVVEMDPGSSLSFDTHYYTSVRTNKGLFSTDASLITNQFSARIVRRFEINRNAFFYQFGRSMQKMGAVGVLTGTAGEIRKKCSRGLVNA